MKQPTLASCAGLVITGLFVWSLAFTGGVAIQCGGIFVLDREMEELTIASPGYPVRYPQFSKCQWTVVSRANKKLRAEFLDFSVEGQSPCLYDKLLVDSDACDFHIPATLCGNTQPPPIESTGNILCFRFLSDYVVNERGFKVKVKLLEDDSYFSLSPRAHFHPGTNGGRSDTPIIPCDVFPVLIANDAIITTPGFDSGKQYPPNIVCRWLVYLDIDHVAVIRFTDMDVVNHEPCDFDSVQIMQGDEAAPNFSQRFCGSQLPDQVTIHDPQLIMFTSDGMIQGQGFAASLKFVFRNLTQGAFSSQGHDEDVKSASVDDVYATAVTATSLTSPSLTALKLQEVVNPAGSEINISQPISDTAGLSMQKIIKSSPAFLTSTTSSNSLSSINNIPSGEHIYIANTTTAPNGTSDSNSNTIILLTSLGHGEHAAVSSTINHFIQQSTNDNINIDHESVSSYVEFTNDESHRKSITNSSSSNNNNKLISDATTNSYIEVASSTVNLISIDNIIGTPVISDNIGEHKSDSFIYSNGVNINGKTDQFGSINICSQTFYNLTSAHLVIQSPGFETGVYPLYVRCDIVVAAEPNKRLKISFHHMDIENSKDCSLDWLEISSRSHSFGRLCGSSASDFLTDDRMIMLTFVSDPIVAKSGFQLQIDKIEDATLTTVSSQDSNKLAVCDSIFGIVDKDGVLVTSPGYSQGVYPLDIACDLKLFVSSAFQKLKVTLLDMDIEQNRACTYDYLIIYDGVSTTPMSLARMCGDQTGVVITTSGPTVQLHFYSDHFVAKRGFKCIVIPDFDSESLTVKPTKLSSLRLFETSGVNVFTTSSGTNGNELSHFTHIFATASAKLEHTAQEVSTTTNVKVLESLLPSSQQSFVTEMHTETSGKHTQTSAVHTEMSAMPTELIFLLWKTLHTVTTNQFVLEGTSSKDSFATYGLSATSETQETYDLQAIKGSPGLHEVPTARETTKTYGITAIKMTSESYEVPATWERVETHEVPATKERTVTTKPPAVKETMDALFGSTLITSSSTYLNTVSSDITAVISSLSVHTSSVVIVETSKYTADESVSTVSEAEGKLASTTLSTSSRKPADGLVNTSVTTNAAAVELYATSAAPIETFPLFLKSSRQTSYQSDTISTIYQLITTFTPSATSEALGQITITTTDEHTTTSLSPTLSTLESACSGVPLVLTEKSALMASPGFLQHENYPTDITCNWIVEGGQGKNISIQFLNFTLEYHPTCSYDFLEFYNVTGGSQILIGRYCGQQFPDTLTSSGDSLVVVFVSDHIGRYPGFLLSYTVYVVAEYQPPCPNDRVRCKEDQLCIPKEWLCDSEKDCPLGDDEEDCHGCDDDEFTCSDNTCLQLYHVCDGISNCNYGEDEFECVNITNDNILLIRKEGLWFPVCFSEWLLSGSQLQWACTASGQGSQLSAHSVTVFSPFYVNLTVTASNMTSIVNNQQTLGEQMQIHTSSKCPENKVMSLRCAPRECGIESTHLPQPYILGSSFSVNGQWPWAVAVFAGADFRCGATLISRQWLVTAAHCVYNLVNSPQITTARLGHVNIQSPEIVVIRIVEVIIHPQNNYIYENDIGLLRLEMAVETNPNQRPVCLDSQPRDWSPNTPCYVAGWGVKDKNKVSNPQVTPILHHAKISIWERFLCERAYPSKIKQSMLCAGYQDGEMDACKGDSGGPLMCVTFFHKWLLVGVVSWGEGCGEIGKPGVYTRVDSYLDWIKSTTDEQVNYGVSCDFEYPNVCGYSSQSDSDFLWTRRMGGVSSPARPYADTTFKNSSGHYMYTYVPYGAKSKTAMLTSPLVSEAQTGYCVQASVIIQDCEQCQFEVRVTDGTGNQSQTLFQVTSKFTTNWMRFELNLPRDTEKINFLSTSGKYYDGGIGIDDVILVAGLCEGSKLLNCGFNKHSGNANDGQTQNTWCAYQQDTSDDFDWIVTHDSGREGNIDGSADDLFLRAQSNGYPGDRARIISPAVQTTIPMCFMFRFRVSSADAGVLTLCRKVYFDETPTLDCIVWSSGASNFKLHTWTDVKVVLSALDIEFSVVFQTTKGDGDGYIDIDNIYKIDGNCI